MERQRIAHLKKETLHNKFMMDLYLHNSEFGKVNAKIVNWLYDNGDYQELDYVKGCAQEATPQEKVISIRFI